MSDVIEGSQRDSILKVVTVLVLLFLSIYIWLLDNGLSSTPRDAERLASPRWSKDKMRDVYKKELKKPHDVKPFLFSRKDRRYIVVGGSGLVGGWIVNHLLQRGEDPRAIRILDMRAPERPEAADGKVSFTKVDVSSAQQVLDAFEAPWDPKVAKLPLTIFHTVAYINAADRKADSMPLYLKVNVEGTRNILEAAKSVKASILIATSSGSVAVRPMKYFFAPWKSAPDDYFQLLVDDDPRHPDGSLETYASCYAYSKALAEKLVLEADDKKAGLRTGAVRPAHAIYGHGVKNSSSIAYDYLRRGGSPSWIPHIVTNFVSAQNVSIAHLAYENKLLADPDTEYSGRAYFCTDPNPPIRYGELYEVLTTLAHPMTPISFPYVPPAPLLLISYVVEAYVLIQRRVLKFLPTLKGDVAMLQPAIFNMSTVHLAYDDSAACEQIGYRGAVTTLLGFCQQVAYWNGIVEEDVEEDVDEGKGGDIEPSSTSVVPKAPNVH